MNLQGSDWLTFPRQRNYFALAIFVTLVYWITNDWFEKGSLISGFGNSANWQSLIYSGLIIFYAVAISIPTFQLWIFILGVSIIPFGLVIELNKINSYLLSSREFNETLWILFSVIPLILITVFTIAIWNNQEIKISLSNALERILGLFGIVTTLVLFSGFFLPWSKSIYKSTISSSDWIFESSGTKTVVEECCLITDQSIWSSIVIITSISVLLILFIFQSIGFLLPRLIFAPSIIYAANEIITYLSGLGTQEPPSNWSTQDIEKAGLTYFKEGLFGGYLFIAAFVILIVILLIPRVSRGASESRFQ